MALKFAVNNSLSAITTLPSSISGGALNLISTQTASASASISFTSGIDSTYDSYVFKFINIHASAAQDLSFQTSINGGSSYGVTATTTNFRAYHDEGGTDTALVYTSAVDLAQSTNFILLNYGSVGTDNDDNCVGTLTLYNPSSTTFVKHFISTTNTSIGYSIQNFTAGYFNTTSAINAVQFKMSSGNIDDGIIKMYGVS